MSTVLRRAAPAPFASRFWTYQRERFPLAAYLPLIMVATLCGAIYSRHARGAAGMPGVAVLGIGIATVLVFFFVLRVLDEHKDAGIDRRYRPELPVPRGLITLGELRAIGGTLLALVLLGNMLLAPPLLWICLAIAGWATLMTREFFAPTWLRARPGLYLLSHMLVMPLIFGYVTALDWLAAGAAPSSYLAAFLAVAFCNGLLIEVGRKIRAPAQEREGVESYSRAWGSGAATVVWLAALLGAAAGVWLAALGTGAAALAGALLLVLLPVAALPALRFLRSATPASAAHLELASGLWTLAVYLLLGAAPLFTA
ncbi:hypothetical protein BH24GEM3_BH24GEM3_26390 [soil metagenome]